ncbi:MAG: cytochrome c3 family protein [Selenomonadaceae bacterium]|nr:cytochrome c3 family protein [Selenomonadaceae bacterium]
MMKEKLRALADWARRKPFHAIGGVLILFVLANVAMWQAEKYPSLACSPCHVMDPYVQGYHGQAAEGKVLAQTHAEAGVNCIDCHDNGIEDKVQETVWYVTDDFDDPPLKRDFGNEMCLKCHKDLDAIVAKTDMGNGVNPHNSHLGDLNCEDCHKMHNKSEAACMKCHDFDFLQTLPAEWMTKDEMAQIHAKK